MIQSKVVEKFPLTRLVAHETEQLEQTAKLAFDLVGRWGPVAATPDGEDSSGRAKLRLQTPEELVQRAFGCAELAMAYARTHGHVAIMPDIEEAYKASNGGNDRN